MTDEHCSVDKHEADDCRSIASDLDPTLPLLPLLERAQQAFQRSAHTLTAVLDAIDRCRQNFVADNITQLCTLIIRGLDTHDEGAMVDTSLLQSNEQQAAVEPVFAHLMHLLLMYQPTRSQGSDIPPDFRVSWPQLRGALDRAMPQLMRSFDPLAVNSESGDSVLHLLARTDRVLVPWMERGIL